MYSASTKPFWWYKKESIIIIGILIKKWISKIVWINMNQPFIFWNDISMFTIFNNKSVITLYGHQRVYIVLLMIMDTQFNPKSVVSQTNIDLLTLLYDCVLHLYFL